MNNRFKRPLAPGNLKVFRSKSPRQVLILKGEALTKALGFSNERAFQRARKKGVIPVRLYPIPGQSSGVYATARDVEKARGVHRDAEAAAALPQPIATANEPSATMRDMRNKSSIAKKFRSVADLISLLEILHGPFMSGRALWRTLGYPSGAAFRQAARRDQLPVETFRIPHRRGRYARTVDVAHWLSSTRSRRGRDDKEDAMDTS